MREPLLILPPFVSRFVAWPLELGLGTHNPRFVVWLLGLGLGTRNAHFGCRWSLAHSGGCPICLCENRKGAKLSCAERYAGVAHTNVRPAGTAEFCLFCGVATALARMRNHVAVHLQKGEVVTDPRMHGQVEPCGFCGRTTGTCTTSIVRKKISSTCPCVVPLKHTVAIRECPIPGCSATAWVLNIKTHLARCRPTVAPNTIDLTEWVVVSQDDEKKTHSRMPSKAWKGQRPRCNIPCPLLPQSRTPSSVERGTRCRMPAQKMHVTT